MHIFWLILAAALFALITFVIGAYNSLIVLRNNAEEGFSTMDVYLKKRYDLVPNLVETVKGFASHEEKTLIGVIEARNIAMGAKGENEQIAAEKGFAGALKSLFAVTENYPELKSDKNFLELQRTLQELEVEISNSRKYYNGTVKAYNIKREMFPTSIIAGIFKFIKKPLYEIDSAEERKNVKISFND